MGQEGGRSEESRTRGEVRAAARASLQGNGLVGARGGGGVFDAIKRPQPVAKGGESTDGTIGFLNDAAKTTGNYPAIQNWNPAQSERENRLARGPLPIGNAFDAKSGLFQERAEIGVFEEAGIQKRMPGERIRNAAKETTGGRKHAANFLNGEVRISQMFENLKTDYEIEFAFGEGKMLAADIHAERGNTFLNGAVDARGRGVNTLRGNAALSEQAEHGTVAAADLESVLGLPGRNKRVEGPDETVVVIAPLLVIIGVRSEGGFPG